jgi:hypothetical protein
MLLSAHLAECSLGRAVRMLRNPLQPNEIQGLRYARTYLTAPFRTGIFPNLGINGFITICAWDDDASIDLFMGHKRAKPYRDGWHARMVPARSVGTLPGLPDLPRQERSTGDNAVAAYTVGRVRYNRFLRFIVTATQAERQVHEHPGYIQGVTLLKPPLVIGTFSLWSNVHDMRQYAVGSYPGGHRHAMRKDEKYQFNHEMFFSRHQVYLTQGQWKGRNPLPMPPSAADARTPDSLRVVDAAS